MNRITLHHVEGSTDNVEVISLDEKSSGGAHHKYKVSWNEGKESCLLSFQLGPVNEVGQNGITLTSLLAVVADMLDDFQLGPCKCDENEAALLNILEALEILSERTRKRIKRGVEGYLKA